ncbi:5-formyltetrahydrofolate cyclo-ligase [Trichomonascus vanleenenianus]|uniref:5-formyltetrahydrofolate cyclo-ligase n=1 Tax=Trichomonascus vanleenenianus TaxID=2268995 RepID=UPI003ECAE308
MKRALRNAIRARMGAVSAESIKLQSEHIAAVLAQVPEYQSAQRVAFYLHMDQGEVQTHGMISQAFDNRKQVFLPKIVDQLNPSFAKEKKKLDMLRIDSMADIHALEPQGKYQLREPGSGVNCFEAGGLDMIVLPGMGFTKRCERIGHGKGFYDSFVRSHMRWCEENNKKRPFLIAVGAREQLVDSIPTEPHDQTLDAVIIDNELFRA